MLHVMESTIGGTRRHITDVGHGLARRGWDVHLVVSAERQPEFRADFAGLEAAGAVVHELPMVRELRPGPDARHVWALRGLMRHLRPALVHTHSSKAGALGRTAARLAGVPRRVHTPHTLAFLFEGMFGPRKRRLFHAVEKRLAASTDRLVAVSESEAETFRRSGVVDPAKVRVVPNGIDPAPFEGAAPHALAELGLDPARVTFAVVGLLNVAKGHDLALDALAAPGNEAAQLLFAGHGALEGELRARAAALGVAQRVAFLGFRADVPRLLASADALLLPSRWEGMPYIVLEAMAAGLPVLATPVDGAKDLVRDGATGWLAGAVDARALALRLRDALDAGPEARRALGARGRERLRARATRSTT
ncbi:MAG: glycosyltransferase [Planctomycetes bacterium]|nr:glycosyltransferase [Planctomycetota bacterium]